MNRKGVEFNVIQIEPGLWKWQFQIGSTVTTGKTRSNLMGIAAHCAQKRIDTELKKLRELSPVASMQGCASAPSPWRPR